MDKNRLTFKTGLLLGIVIFPLSFLLDLIIYPDHLWELLCVRLAISFLLVIALILVDRVNQRMLHLLGIVAPVLCSLAMTLMCRITGEGFGSPYYISHCIVLVISSILFHIKTIDFIIIIIGCLVPHFIILPFSPWSVRDLTINIYMLGIFATASALVHHVVYKLITEINTLSGLMPICMYCKSIRDDKGYWERVENFVASRADVSFSHGVCPDCQGKLSAQIDNIKRIKQFS